MKRKQNSPKAKATFKSFLGLHVRTNSAARKLKMEVPEVKSWAELRIHIRGQGLGDDDLVEARALWQSYKKY